MKKRLHLYISGKVQGVTFRHFTKTNAQRIGVKGWVKNRPDRKVEAILEGEKSKIKKLLEKLKEGPRLANVKEIRKEEEDYIGEFETFKIKY